MPGSFCTSSIKRGHGLFKKNNFGSSFVVVDGNKELYRYIRPGYLTSKYYAKGSTVAEFTAIIEATEFIINKRLDDVTIYSDSADAIKNIISFGKITDNEIKINVVNWWCFKHNIPKTRLINPLTHKIAPIISKSLMVR